MLMTFNMKSSCVSASLSFEKQGVFVIDSECGLFFVLPPRFNGRNCGFPTSAQALSQFDTLMPLPATPGGDDEQQTRFEELQRQSGLSPSLQWESAVENYITLKNMADL